MSNTQPKGLLTSLVLFITLGLFSLATLFTILILEVRSGQQQLNSQLAALTGETLPSPQPSSHPSGSPGSEQFGQLQATLDLIATRQRVNGTTELKLPTTLTQTLQQIQQAQSTQDKQISTLLKQQQAQQMRSTQVAQQIEEIANRPTPAAPEVDLSALDQITLQLQQIHTTQKQFEKREQQQKSLQDELSSTLPTLQQAQQEHSKQIIQQINRIADRPVPATPEVDLSALDQIASELKKIRTTQQRHEKRTLQPPQQKSSSATLPTKEIDKRLDQLVAQQKKIQSSQTSIAQSVQKITKNSPTPTPSTEVMSQLKQLQTQQQKISAAQHSLQTLVEKVAQQQSSRPHQQAPTPPQQRIERDNMKSMGQSNTIKPYSYNAR